MEPASFVLLKQWLAEKGGSFHEKLQFQAGASDNAAVALECIHADSTIITCPFSLVITEELAQRNLSRLFSISDIIGWTERQWICTYIIFHWILSDSKPLELEHYPYINILPLPEQLRTPLHFTTEELQAFRGTIMYQATINRQNELKDEWQNCQSAIIRKNSHWGKGMIWERYLTAATYLSSRAFPSSILSQNPTLVATSDTKPVLLPGLDSFNHKRAQPVSWSVTFPLTSNQTSVPQQPTISLVLHSDVPAGGELFGNYGPKPNAELVLGYGFSLPNNPDDTIVLKIGGYEKRWEVGRQAKGADTLWEELVYIIEQDSSPDEPDEYETQMDAADLLASMVRILQEKLPSESKIKNLNLRPEVATMWQDYVEGQVSILSSILDFCKMKEAEAVELARSLGIELIVED